MTEKPAADLLADIGKFLNYQKTLGIQYYPRSQMVESFLAAGQKNIGEVTEQGKAAPKKQVKPSDSTGKKHGFDPELETKTTLRDVREQLGNCERCHLHKTRTNIVFGQGSASAKLMLIADAPSRDDDRLNSSFQGNAGELLDKMLSAIDLSRDEVYLTTLVKCFPGNNGRPREQEIKTCLPFLFRQIKIIGPTVICPMGMLSAQNLLQSNQSLFQLRGRFYSFNKLCCSELDQTIVVMPSLHPSLLLENPDLKKASWHDLQMIRKKIAQ